MKILLIPPAHQYPNYPTPLSFSDFPMAWPYLTAALHKAGHQVESANVNNVFGYVDGLTMIRAVITTRFREFQPNLIGLGGICTNYLFIRDAIGIIRAQCKTPIVLGGGIVTNDPEFIFNHFKPDYAIVGEAEETLVKLATIIGNVAECRAKGQDVIGNWDGIPNLYYWR